MVQRSANIETQLSVDVEYLEAVEAEVIPMLNIEHDTEVAEPELVEYNLNESVVAETPSVGHIHSTLSSTVPIVDHIGASSLASSCNEQKSPK
jgi:hypothetical protein